MEKVGATGLDGAGARRIATLAMLALAMSMEGGPCGDRGPTPVVVRNESNADVFIKVVGASGSERDTHTAVAAGAEGFVHELPSADAAGAGTCTTRVLVARTGHGREIDRVEPPLCRGDTWIIGD